MTVKVQNLSKALKMINGLKKEIRENIISSGLDNTLNRELNKLKKDLLKNLNTSGKIKIKLPRGDGGFDQIKLTKSNKEMLKALADIDLENVSKTRNNTALVQNNVAVASSKRLKDARVEQLGSVKVSRMASGLDIVVPMHESDTLESHLQIANKFFNNALFVIFDDNGNAHYYKNPGIDLTPYVKIVCSNATGNTERSQQVFNRHKTGERPGNRKNSSRTPKDHAVYSLKKEAFDLIKRQCIDLTPIVEKMKYGEYDDAEALIQKAAKSQTLSSLLDKVKDYKKGDKLASSTQSYKNVVELIKNLKLKKTKKKDSSYYTLVTSYDDKLKDEMDVESELFREIQVWKIDGSEKWVADLLKKQINIIKKLVG